MFCSETRVEGRSYREAQQRVQLQALGEGDAGGVGAGPLPFVCSFCTKIVNNCALKTSKSEHVATAQRGSRWENGPRARPGTLHGLLRSAPLRCLPPAAVTWWFKQEHAGKPSRLNQGGFGLRLALFPSLFSEAYIHAHTDYLYILRCARACVKSSQWILCIMKSVLNCLGPENVCFRPINLSPEASGLPRISGVCSTISAETSKPCLVISIWEQGRLTDKKGQDASGCMFCPGLTPCTHAGPMAVSPVPESSLPCVLQPWKMSPFVTKQS